MSAPRPEAPGQPGSAGPSGEARLALVGVDVARAGRTVLAGIDLALRPGELTVVIGPNGVGKSTLVRALAGLVAPARGRVLLDGAPLDALPSTARARAIACVLEQPDATFGFTARELVTMGRYPHVGRAFEGPEDRAAVERALSRLGLDALADRPFARLSSGERQRVALARALAQDAPIMLFDEPTARLDPYHALSVAALLGELAAERTPASPEGRTVLAVEHDLDLAAQCAKRLIILSHSGEGCPGRVVADGPPADVLTVERVAAVYGVRARRLDGERTTIVIDRALR
ncbi:MAG: ABC transporter ATP-binding protein [Deltaproteobacteria bacterium]|nr:ABC transporter ATP-binding protein [Deltaproteobacteria bacterium]